jgi:hypothetical protein
VSHTFDPVHTVPFDFEGFVHIPVVMSHVPAVWHWSLAEQETAVPPHTPPVQTSVVVHLLPSLHVVPLAAAGLEHTPFVQVPATWHWSLAAHAWPHEPQLFGSVFVFASQPLAPFMSQSCSGGVQTRPPHVPLAHDSMPPATVHACPQVPQLLGSAAVWSSQPSAFIMLQSPQPVVHAMAHVPLAHEAVPFAVPHFFLHAPQLLVSVFVLTSQPLAFVMSQSAKPALQLIEHIEAAHDAVPLAVPQALPQPPQFVALVDVFTSHPSAGFMLQSAFGSMHVIPQTPFVHAAMPPTAVQACPQAPQLLVSVPVPTSQPFVGLWSQSEKPAAQPFAGMLHGDAVPGALHTSVTWFVLHEVLQSPQWLGVLIAVSQPSLAMPLQSACVGSVQTTLEQTPLTQLSVAPPAVLHAWPQPLQLSLSVLVLISQPFAALWSQSWKPALHAMTEHA